MTCDIKPMTVQMFIEKVKLNFPLATIGEDNEGQLIIYTDYMVDYSYEEPHIKQFETGL